MKNKRKICAALMLISFMFQNAIVKGADDEILTGSCNGYQAPSCEWKLNTTDGTIVFENPEEFIVEELVMDDELKWLVEKGVIADGTKQIINWPFNNMAKLKEVFLPDTLTRVKSLIYGCSKVEELTFDGFARIDSACDICAGLKVINLGRSVYVSPTATDTYDYPIYYSIATDCPNLISVNVDEENLKIKSVNGALLTKD